MTSQEQKHLLVSTNFAHKQRKYSTLCPAYHGSHNAKYFRRCILGKNTISGEESHCMFTLQKQPLTGIVE